MSWLFGKKKEEEKKKPTEYTPPKVAVPKQDETPVTQPASAPEVFQFTRVNNC
jgi:hypothetical protein